MTRRLTPEQASAVYDVLVEEAGASDNERAKSSFVQAASFSSENPYPVQEYRFGGLLHWGGKFRNNSRGIYVDCYREHDTPARLAAIERTNARLAALFGEGGA